jgi:hypothetical protein
MKKVVFTALAAAGIGLTSLPASSAPITSESLNPQLGLVEQAQMSSYCRRLRRACAYKEERDQVGEGNCRRYRTECLRGYRDRR